jgi:hypothetical protein
MNKFNRFSIWCWATIVTYIGTVALFLLLLHGCASVQSLFGDQGARKTSCQVLCGVETFGHQYCLKSQPDIWGVFSDGIDLATCLTTCDENFDILNNSVDIGCLANIYYESKGDLTPSTVCASLKMCNK